MSDKPAFSLWLWVAIEVLYILSLAAKPSPYRKLWFLAILAVAYYSLVHTKMYIKDPFSTMGFATRLSSVVMFASTYILLSEPQQEMKILGDKRDISSRPYRERVWWAWKLWGNPRGIGWTHEPKGGRIPPKPQGMSRRGFVLRQLGWLVATWLLFDINGLINRVNPYYSTPVPQISGFQWLWRLHMLGFGFNVMLMITIEYQVASIICILLGFTQPEEWPPFFGSVFDAYTVGRYWGVMWHQQFRFAFIKHTEALTKLLGLAPRSNLSNGVKLFGTFLLSGIFHWAGDTSMLGPKFVGTLTFFCLQPIGIILESTVVEAAKKAGFKRANWLTYGLGYLWVCVWLATTLPLFVDSYYRMGYRETMPRFSLFLGLWNGTWEWE